MMMTYTKMRGSKIEDADDPLFDWIKSREDNSKGQASNNPRRISRYVLMAEHF